MTDDRLAGTLGQIEGSVEAVLVQAGVAGEKIARPTGWPVPAL